MYDDLRSPIRPATTSILAIAAALLIACAGFLPAEQGDLRGVRPNPDVNDRAERARLMRDYQRAEAMLKDRLKKNPDDDHAHRLLGDVNLTRGQDYRKKWKENLGRAFDSYSKAVALKPTNCSYWARVSGVVAMAYDNDASRIPGSAIASLPLAAGWDNCTNAALVQLNLLRDPDPEVAEAWDEEHKDASREERIRALQPWVVDAWERAPLSHTSWIEDHARTPLIKGTPFVVVNPPLQARGVEHEYHRGVNEIERFTTGRVSGDRVVFTDRRFPKKLPRNAVVKAQACQYSSWKDNDLTGVATGSCSTSTFLRGKSPLYAPERLVSAGPGHYEFTSIRPAIIAGDEIMFESVRCLGGSIQKKFEYTPTCPVAYDKPNWLLRSLPAAKVLGTRGTAHADQIIEAAAMRPIWGDELSERMIRGDFGVGMPYAAFQYARDNLKGCTGRALLARHMINGGELEWTCFMGEDGTDAFTFVDLQLVWFGKKAEYDASMATTPAE